MRFTLLQPPFYLTTPLTLQTAKNKKEKMEKEEAKLLHAFLTALPQTPPDSQQELQDPGVGPNSAPHDTALPAVHQGRLC